MCTVSWLHHKGGYQLLCNRDERHTRKAALPPSVDERNQVRFLAPRDGDQGGSWIGVNQFGLSLCLLNRYLDEAAATDAQRNMTSRGLLLLESIDCRSRAELRDRIERANLKPYRPFTMLVLEPGRPALVIHWTGARRILLCDAESEMPLVSSSYDAQGVNFSRRRVLEDMAAEPGGVNGEILGLFHRSHSPAASAYSPCMHRDDAYTVSFSRILVSRDRIEFSYRPNAPCAGEREELTLEIHQTEN